MSQSAEELADMALCMEAEEWSRLRAIEWGRLPLVMSMTVAPVLLLFWSYLPVIGLFFCMNIAWAFVRYRLINATVARLADYIARPVLPVCLLSAIYFFVHRAPERAIVA